MSRSTDEWIGKHDDQAIPPRVRLRVFQTTNGCCFSCGARLVTRWDIDHAKALINGGEHREGNLVPLCKPCHGKKTAQDVKLKAKVARVRQRHLGIKKPRTIRAWRNFRREIVTAPRER